MAATEKSNIEMTWHCLLCRGLLVSEAFSFRCSDCGNLYPIVADVPILVRDPAAYLKSQMASLTQASRDAKKRLNEFDEAGSGVGLSNVSLARHRNVLDAKINCAETFIALLEPARRVLEDLVDSTRSSLGVRRSGWAIWNLLPYFLRDWADTSELQATKSMIGIALKHAIPDPSTKSVVFAACGGGGLLAGNSFGFKRVFGFDLSLPILTAARCLLDGQSLDIPIPRTHDNQGRITLLNRAPPCVLRVDLLAMDAFDTAFADGSIDCVITAFMMDILGEPRKLAKEVHRILASDGVWINYGPSGVPERLWNFDETEGRAFFEEAGFSVVWADAHRTTELDLTRVFPSTDFRSKVCYVTSVRKGKHAGVRPKAVSPNPAEIQDKIPRHFLGAGLVRRQDLGTEQTSIVFLRNEKLGGGEKFSEIDEGAAQAMALVDGKRTVREIAEMLAQGTTAHPMQDTYLAFAQYFNEGLLRWRS